MYELAVPIAIMVGMMGVGFGIACYVSRAMSYYRLERRIASLERLVRPVKQTNYQPKKLPQTQPYIRYHSVDEPQPVIN